MNNELPMEDPIVLDMVGSPFIKAEYFFGADVRIIGNRSVPVIPKRNVCIICMMIAREMCTLKACPHCRDNG